jgi:hypothetical protein
VMHCWLENIAPSALCPGIDWNLGPTPPSALLVTLIGMFLCDVYLTINIDDVWGLAAWHRWIVLNIDSMLPLSYAKLIWCCLYDSMRVILMWMFMCQYYSNYYFIC